MPNDSALLQWQVENAARLVGLRAQRLTEALHALCALTRVVLAGGDDDAAAVRAWLAEEEFALDPLGRVRNHRPSRRLQAGEAADRLVNIHWDLAQTGAAPEAARLRRLARLAPEFRALQARFPALAWISWRDETGGALTWPACDPDGPLSARPLPAPRVGDEAGAPESDPTVRWAVHPLPDREEGSRVTATLAVRAGTRCVGAWTIEVAPEGLTGSRVSEILMPGQQFLLCDREGRLLVGGEAPLNDEAAVSLAGLGGGYAGIEPARLIRAGGGQLEIAGADGAARVAAFAVVPAVAWLLFSVVPVESLANGAAMRERRPRKAVAAFRATLDGRIIGCNEAFARLLGYGSPRDILSLTAGRFFYDPQAREALRGRLLAQGEVGRESLRLRRRDGTPISVVQSARLIEPATPDQPRLIEGVCVDPAEPGPEA